MFGAAEANNSKRFLFCLGSGVLFYKLARHIYSAASAASVVFNHHYYRSTFNKQKFKERYGANCWVLITGFTDGIGLGFAQ